MLRLERYSGMKSRHTCPSCGQKKSFVRYVNDQGEYLADDAGRCNRESKCGYHYSPKMYYADHPEAKPAAKPRAPRRRKAKPVILQPPAPPISFHSKQLLDSTVGRHRTNPFMQFLFDLFRDDPEGIAETADRYFVGMFDELTCFWQIDIKGRIRKGKLMRYNPRTGKRQPVFKFKDEDGDDVEIPAYWVHRVLQKRNQLPEDVNFQNCFFGEHLLRRDRERPVGIVEAEKTAILCSICFPDITWIAVGAQRHLSRDKMSVLLNRKVILYPDADAFQVWNEKTIELQRFGIEARISTALEDLATPEEKEKGFDLADYLIREQQRINEYNLFVRDYNARMDWIEAQPGHIPPAMRETHASRIVQSVY